MIESVIKNIDFHIGMLRYGLILNTELNKKGFQSTDSKKRVSKFGSC